MEAAGKIWRKVLDEKESPESEQDKEKKKEAQLSSLVKKAAARDPEAFVEVMEACKLSMYRVAKSILASDEDVADAMSETVLTAWEKLSQLKKPEAFKTWLFRILVHTCEEQFRRKEQVWQSEDFPEMESLERGYEELEWMQTMEKLGETYRSVLVLYYIEGMKLREIARILHISETAAGTRLVRGREKLAELFGEPLKKRGKE